MANTFLLAQGKAVGKSLAEPDRVEDAQRIMAAAEEAGVKLDPPDRRGDGQGSHAAAPSTRPSPTEKLPASWHIVDVGKAVPGA